jgi:ankyrin repeat protein
LLLH